MPLVVVAREWYIAPTLIPTSKQIYSYITFAALWRPLCTNSPNILVVMADLMTLMFGFFLRCSHLNMWSLQFHQWDPGGCFFVYVKGDFDSNLFAHICSFIVWTNESERHNFWYGWCRDSGCIAFSRKWLILKGMVNVMSQKSCKGQYGKYE